MKKKTFWIALLVLLFLQLILLSYYGNRKAGFHEDELYTYYSSNKTAGLFVNDRQWTQRDQLRNDFVVLKGEQFRYSVVKQMQSWDVHPPIYYYIFHTACSLFPGVFSKWLGIGVNMAAYLPCFFLLAWIAFQVSYSGSGDKEQARLLSFLTCMSWGFSAAVISGVMFIRMYQWLTLFVLLCLMLHLRAVRDQDFTFGRFLLPVGITVFLGFLTQYYYVIFHFFLGAAFLLFLLFQKKWKELISYVLSCGAAFLLAILYYPASLSHIFRGYRGTEAVSEFADASNTLERIRFFFGLFDDYVMHNTLCIWLLLILLMSVTLSYLKKKKKRQGNLWNESLILIAVSALGYFLTVSKTALLLGETSNRYELPVYGLFLFLLLYFVWRSLTLLLWDFVKNRQIFYKALAGVLAVIFLLLEGTALTGGRVFFLYEQERDTMEFVKENRQEPVIVFYNEASSDNIWWLSDELMEYDRFYLASQGDQEPVKEKEFTEGHRILAYVADYENKEACLSRLLSSNAGLSSYRMIAEKGLWTLYELE